jgi:hypothetical protein
MTEKSDYPVLDECFKQIAADRDKVTAFYDVRYVFASYVEVLAALTAAMLKNKIYSREYMEEMLMSMVEDALTRESKTECIRHCGSEAIVGGKQ